MVFQEIISVIALLLLQLYSILATNFYYRFFQYRSLCILASANDRSDSDTWKRPPILSATFRQRHQNLIRMRHDRFQSRYSSSSRHPGPCSQPSSPASPVAKRPNPHERSRNTRSYWFVPGSRSLICKASCRRTHILPRIIHELFRCKRRSLIQARRARLAG